VPELKVDPQGDKASTESPPQRSWGRYLSAVMRIAGSRPVRWGFVTLALALAVYAVVKDWGHIGPDLARLGVGAIAAALGAVLLALATTGLLYRLLLAALGSPLPLRTAARILFIGQLGKYLPGSIWPVLAQMELGKRHDIPRHRSASASVLVMLFTLITGLLTALVTLPFAAGQMPYRWALLAAPLLLVLVYPRVLNAVIGRLLRLARQPALDQPLTLRTVLSALGCSFAGWVFYGLQIWILADRLGAPAGKTVLIAIGGFAFAWSVGFVVIFAPAGAGVRDVLLLLVLGPVLSTASATVVVLVSRVLLTAADLLAAGVAAAFTKRGALGAAPAPPPP
jgi:glycosyltransferase 2 family protein